MIASLDVVQLSRVQLVLGETREQQRHLEHSMAVSAGWNGVRRKQENVDNRKYHNRTYVTNDTTEDNGM